jgi:hypothetical protein
MGIEIVKDCHLEEDLLVKNETINDNISGLQTQSGLYDLGYTYNLRWVLSIMDNKMEVTFTKVYNGNSETIVLDKNNLKASFGDYWHPHNSVTAELSVSFDSKQLILNGKRCSRRNFPGTFNCTYYNDVIVTSW